MMPGQLKRILMHGESATVEFKEARDALPCDLFDKARRWIKARHPDHAWLGMSDRDILKKGGMLRRIGPDKGGHWEVMEETKS